MALPPHVRLANDIASQFHQHPPQRAAEEIANHISLFWDPRMRAQLLQHVDQGGFELDPLVMNAAQLLRPRPSRLT